jgi:hypothetical protein
MADDGVIAWWKGSHRAEGPTVKTGNGVTNDPAAYAALQERRRKAGDVLPFAPATPRDPGEYGSLTPGIGAGRFDFPHGSGW